MESKATVAIVVTCLLALSAFVVVLSPSGDTIDTNTSTEDTTDLYTLAGFRVVTSYKCIFPTCTDFWCNANCNHHPKYCPASFCKKVTTRIAIPTRAPTATPTEAMTEPEVVTPTESPTEVSTDAPTVAPTPAPTCEVQDSQVDMSQCHNTCTSGYKLPKLQRQEQKGAVTTDQCLNCFCAGCDDSKFQKNCGGVRPTVAYCGAASCCPDTCKGGEWNVRIQMCESPECCGCAPALFGNNCGGKVPDACSAR
jgi:hypothetical protein